METKILHFLDQKDKDFINNNPNYKKDFEDLCNVSDINNFFGNFKDSIVSIAILDNHIVSMAVGWEDKDCLSITDVFTSATHRGKGLCKSVVGALLDNWWEKSQFKNNFSIKLGVTNDNVAAIKCYKHFGFTEIPNSESETTNSLGENIIRIQMILTKESYAEKYLLPIKVNNLKTLQKTKNNDLGEQLKIIDSNIKEDRDFILNNPRLSKEFEENESFWNETMIKDGYPMNPIKSPHIIEKYKSKLKTDNGISFYSPTLIKYTASEIFDEYKDTKFSLLITDDEIVGYAIGFISENNYKIKHVRSFIKGSCTKIIQNLINSYWDPKKLQFKSLETNDNPSMLLYVFKNNDGAIGCYKKCGFEKIGETLWSHKMIVTKERYIEKYLLPLTEKKLQERLKRK